MRHLLVFLLLAGCVAVGPGGYDRRELGAVRSVTYGTIEKVHPVPMEDDAGEELVIRLDDGNRVAVVQPGWQGLQAGDRVRVLMGTKASRVERGAVGSSELPVSEALAAIVSPHAAAPAALSKARALATGAVSSPSVIWFTT
jgi:outer membrane lipoprotein SlyB